MAIAIDASSQFSSDPANAQPVTFTGPTVSAPAGTDIIVFACCDAPPGNPTSTITITGLTGGNSVFEILTINQGGFGAGPAAITVWAGTANGTPFEVTQEGQNGAQNSQAQGVYVLTGATGIVATGNFRGTGTPTINGVSPGAGHLALCGFIDSPNTLDTMSPAFSVVTDQAVVPDADTVPSFFGHLFVGAGAFSVGIDALPNQGETNGIMVLVEPEADPTASGVLAITLPVPNVEFDAEATAAGELDALIPVLQVGLVGELASAGALDISLPVPVAEIFAEVSAAAQLDIILPVPDVNFDGQVLIPASGVLGIVLPVPNVNLAGQSAAGGQTVGPCGWTIPEPLCPTTAWTEASPALQAAGRDYAALILWAATGRQFGLCEVSVRPCGMERCGDMWSFFGWNWASGTWNPYIFNGTWFNCGCAGICSCDPRCRVRLMGPVDSVLEVTIGGMAVDPNTYRVDDDHWLVRTGGECWPECADMNEDIGENVFVVTYLRGTPVPSALLQAAATLAMEWVAACSGADCRLSSRVTSMVRSGISIEMVDPQQMLEMGLTGITEIDMLLVALNPYGKKERGRLYAPELRIPKIVTSP